MTHDEIISTLNELVETSKDGEYGFKTCAEDVKDMETSSASGTPRTTMRSCSYVSAWWRSATRCRWCRSVPTT